MPYAKLISYAMEKKNINSKELANQSVLDETYISKILKGEKIPKEDKSIKLAKVLDIDERELILEGYLDKAPQEILDLLNMFCNFGYAVAKKMFEKSTEMLSNAGININSEEFDNIAEGEPMARILLDIVASTDCIVQSTDNLSNTFKLIELNPKTGKIASELNFKNPSRNTNL